MNIIIEDNTKEIKKYLKGKIEDLGDEIKFTEITPKKISAIITRQNGQKDKVYWLRDEGNGSLKSDWYYNDTN